MRRLIATLALITVPSTIHAADGNMLIDICRTGSAIYYVAGVIETLEFTETDDRLCIPDRVSNQQLVDVVCKSLNENPQSRHRSAIALTYGAFKKAFPCKS